MPFHAAEQRRKKTEQRCNLFEPLKVASFAAPDFSKLHRGVSRRLTK
jgi:hypothetical protein